MISERGGVLLDSSLGSPAVGRFSFIGMDPVAVFTARRNDPLSHPFDADIEVTRYRSAAGEVNPLAGDLQQPSTDHSRGDVLEALRGLLGEYAVSFEARAEELFPLLGGAIGFFGYEAGSWGGPGEQIKTTSDSSIPDVYFAVYDQLLCHDHATNETYISTVGRDHTMPGARAAAAQRTESLRERLKNPTLQRKSQPAGGEATPRKSDPYPEPRGCFDAAEYCDTVARIRDHIDAGDIYQACMTQRFENRMGTGDPWQLYCQLRKTNPAPFACYLKTTTFSIVSASPERYLAVDRQGTAESRPIKGTRPRGETAAMDDALRKELSESSKDRAENVMIVDLVRNDFGRVCRFGSIKVPELMQIETYATVFQMVSTVRGDLRSECDALDLVRATFPGGSMTGAPKTEAMKILNRLEPVRRGVYAGGIGYLDYAGSIDLNMVIRSFIIEDRNVFYHGGGGIVADSIPEAEYQESLDKVVALERALGHLKESSRQESESISSGDSRSER